MKNSLLFLLSLLSIGCTNNKETKTEEEISLVEVARFEDSDTLKEHNYIAVFDDKTEGTTELSQLELKIVNEYLIEAVKEYYEKQEQKYKLDLKNYFRQYFVSTNSNGDKIVKVFCFCQHNGDIWRAERLEVHDGGDCYFNVMINITKAHHDQLKPHGMA